MKKTPRRLNLSRHTIRLLTDAQASTPFGGTSIMPICPYSDTCTRYGDRCDPARTYTCPPLPPPPPSFGPPQQCWP